VFSCVADRCGDEILDVFDVWNSPSLSSLQLKSGTPIDFQQGIIKVSSSR
jgi:hypothetical protein